MYTKNLLSYNYKVNIGAIIARKAGLIKILILLLFSIVLFANIIGSINFFEYFNNRNISVADFKTDISMLSETAGVLEIERASNKHSEISEFGSDGNIVNANELKPDLSTALIKIADINNDEKVSNEEIVSIGLMKLKTDTFQKELNVLQFNLRSADHNLKNFMVITKGKYAGTVLYNGSLKFIDDEHKRYFGLELSTDIGTKN